MRGKRRLMSKIPGHVLNPNGHMPEKVRIGTQIESINNFIGRMISGQR